MKVGVLGAGTMGAGIAQVALQHGHEVVLYDVAETGLEKGHASIAAGLAKLVEKSKLDASARAAALGRLRLSKVLHDLSDVDLAIEAATESISIKQDLFRYLDEFCRPDAVLASNTSSLSITAIAACTRRPERVIGLHFFNPAPLMALVEVVAAHQSGAAALEAGRDFVVGLGKTPVLCQDTPGFIVNRVARPFYGEALKVLGEGGARLEAIDALMKAGGFRMGPFELMDLIGIDVNFAVTQSVYQAFFGEARFRPHPLQQRMVASGRLGRKSNQGFYSYPAAETSEPARLPNDGVKRRYVLAGGPPDLAAWGRVISGGGHDALLLDTSVSTLHAGLWPDLEDVAGAFEVGPGLARDRQAMQQLLAERLPREAFIASTDLTRTATAAMASHGRPAVVIGDWAGEGKLWEVALAEGTDPRAALGALDLPLVEVADHPGLVFARVVSMLANEAAFAMQEGVASAADIDSALRLGANYPRGPLEWADALGPAAVVALLDSLHQGLGEERYRVAPLLRRRAQAGLPLREPALASSRS